MRRLGPFLGLWVVVEVHCLKYMYISKMNREKKKNTYPGPKNLLPLCPVIVINMACRCRCVPSSSCLVVDVGTLLVHPIVVVACRWCQLSYSCHCKNLNTKKKLVIKKTMYMDVFTYYTHQWSCPSSSRRRGMSLWWSLWWDICVGR